MINRELQHTEHRQHSTTTGQDGMDPVPNGTREAMEKTTVTNPTSPKLAPSADNVMNLTHLVITLTQFAADVDKEVMLPGTVITVINDYHRKPHVARKKSNTKTSISFTTIYFTKIV